MGLPDIVAIYLKFCDKQRGEVSRFLSQNFKYVAAIVLVLGLGNPLTVSPGT